jgi:hypothetical protein
MRQALSKRGDISSAMYLKVAQLLSGRAAMDRLIAPQKGEAAYGIYLLHFITRLPAQLHGFATSLSGGYRVMAAV